MNTTLPTFILFSMPRTVVAGLAAVKPLFWGNDGLAPSPSKKAGFGLVLAEKLFLSIRQILIPMIDQSDIGNAFDCRGIVNITVNITGGNTGVVIREYPRMGEGQVNKVVALPAERLCNLKVFRRTRKGQVQAFSVGIERQVREGASDGAPLVKVFLRIEVAAIVNPNGINRTHTPKVCYNQRGKVSTLRKRKVVRTCRDASGEAIAALLCIAHGPASKRTGAGVMLDKVFVREVVVGGKPESDDVISTAAGLSEFFVLIPPRPKSLCHRRTPRARQSSVWRV